MPPKRQHVSKQKRSGRGIGDWFRNLGNQISSGVKSLGNRDTYVNLAKQAIDPYVKLKDAAIDAGKSLADKNAWRNAIVNPKDTWESQTKPWLKNHNIVSTVTGLATGGVPGMIASNAIKKTTGFGRRMKRGGTLYTPGGGKGLSAKLRRKGLGIGAPGGMR